MRIILGLLLISFISGCGDGVEDPRFHTKTAVDHKQMMIDGMNAIITSVRHFNPEHLTTSFRVHTENMRSPKRNPEVYFFGEKHTEIIGKIENLGAINYLAHPGDYVLLEGVDRTMRLVYPNCGLYLVYGVYVQWIVEKRGKDYDPDKQKEWLEKQNLFDLLKETESHYDLSGLNIANVTCGFWDDGRALEDDITYASLKIRNISITKAIHQRRSYNRQIFVEAGYRHLPIGEYFQIYGMNEKSVMPTDFSTYYAQVKQERRRAPNQRSMLIDDTAGSTRVIYNYLSTNDIPYAEFIHGKMRLR